jgi:hypothetical protein
MGIVTVGKYYLKPTKINHTMKKLRLNQSLYLFAMLLFVGAFSACNDDPDQEPMPMLEMESFTYAFNEGQLLDSPATAYEGEHPRNLMAKIMVEENIDGTSKVTISLMNTLNGRMYPVHAHDAADPATTPNGTPYNESPNGAIFAGMISGNGGTAMASNDLDISFNELTRNYEGFFVVHDPTQDLSTTDLTTYLVLGLFAR